MYVHGQGVVKSVEKYFELYALAANREHAGAQYNLGVYYTNGMGVAQSYEKSSELYTLAANQGRAEA